MSKQTDLEAMRRTLIEAAWLDYKLFGYRTDSVDALAQKIRRYKAGVTAAKPAQQITFGLARRKAA